VIPLQQPRSVRVVATASGRHDFQELQLVRDGQVIQRQPAEKKEGGWSARLTREVRLEGAAWFAVRIESQTRNEFERALYAHTSPVYVDFAGQRVFSLDAARGLLRQLEQAQEDIRARGQFSSPETRDKVLGIYSDAARALQKRINERGKR